MPQDFSDPLREELATLYAETMALQILFVSFCSSLMRSGQVSDEVVTQAFDKASDFLTAMQMRFAEVADVRHTGGAVKIVDELRTAIFQEA